jgi:2',3'-cyclic-nucleotide 2'-phosphodiesterase (5'-nucleotidase family)
VKRIALVLLLLLHISPAIGQQDTGHLTISIIGTNDLHGGVVSREGRGGLALFAGYVQNLRGARARDGGGVVLVDAGDMFQGTLESNLDEGAPVVAAYNLLGYAAAAIGNHEFDYGPAGPAVIPTSPAEDARGALKARAAEARFPFLAANIADAATGLPVDWPNVRPSVMVDAAGVKVGILGVTTADTLTTTIAANVRGLAIVPLAASITAEAGKLRAAGATVVIVAAHAGASCTNFDNPVDLSSCDTGREIFTVARSLPAGLVDVIVAGHTHSGIAHQIDGIAIMESYSSGRAFGRVDVTLDRVRGSILERRSFPPEEIDGGMYENATVVPDSGVERILAPAIARAAAVKAEPLGVTVDAPISRLPPGESALGNLFADLMRASVPGADLALSNSGGVRTDLPAGPLTYGRFFEAMPFDNRLVRVTLTGAQLRQVFANNFRVATSVRIPVSGVRVEARCQGGALRVVIIRDSGAPVGDDEHLAVATSDFVALGGDGILAPIGVVNYTDVAGPGMRDAMVEQLRRRGGRLRSDDLTSPERPRIVYPADLPARCAA